MDVDVPEGHIIFMTSSISRFIGRFISVFGAALVVASAGADAATTGQRLTVVELYTSLACSTCPLADEVLAELVERDDVLALSFHVDYWDYAGWSDPYADNVYTQRQERYLERLNIPYMLTPQVVINGTFEGTGSDMGVMEELIAEAHRTRMNEVEINLNRTALREMRISLPAMEYAGNAEVILVRYDAVHETIVSGGDNDGRVLTNVNVVRQFRVHSLWKGDAITFDVPLEELGDHDDLQFYAVIVQEPGQGAILGASYIDLRDNI